MMQFLSDNLAVIIVVIVAIVAVIVLARFGYKKEVRSILLYLVASAEEKCGGGTGEIKYSSVIASLYEKLPVFARLLLSEKTLSSLIEEAVSKLKNYLSSGQIGESD